MAKKSVASVVKSHIVKSGLPLLEDPPVAVPGIHLHTTRTKSDPRKKGLTRMGGCPDLPPDVDWPEESGGEPLGFIGQLNLSDFPTRGVLPKRGLLSFFAHYDVDSRDTYRVLYFPESAPLKRRSIPEDMDELNGCAPCKVETSKILTLPSPDAIAKSVWRPKKAELETYNDLLNQIMTDVRDGGSSLTWLLGNAHWYYGDMRGELTLQERGLRSGDRGAKALVKRAPDEWRLLLQVDTDEQGTEFCWGDMGTLFFWIRNEDLAARNFDNVWAMIMGG